LELDLPLLTLIVATIGAIASIILTIIEFYARIYNPSKKQSKQKEKKSIKSLKTEYERCAWAISNNLDKYVKMNAMTEFEASFQGSWVKGDAKISEELKSQVQKYNEKLKEYNMFRKFSEPLIMGIIEKEVRKIFLKTRKKSDAVEAMLCSDFLMARYFNGEKVTTTWFREEHPRALNNITKEIDESERDDIDLFFNHVNDELQKNEVLVRFRKEKKELIELGQAILKDLEEGKDLQKKLEEYKDIEEEIPEMAHNPYS